MAQIQSAPKTAPLTGEKMTKKSSLKAGKLENLIAQVRAVAVEIGFLPPVKGERNMLRILAAILDYRGIRPLKTTGKAKNAWLTTNNYDQIKTDRLLRVLKEHLPELLTEDSPVLSNPVSKLDTAKLDNGKLDTPKLDKAERKALNIAGWTVRQDAKGFYRAFRKINGKTKCVYIGRALDGAHEKLQEASRRGGPTHHPAGIRTAHPWNAAE